MKLSSLIKYQCWTTIKPVLCFYGILYGIVTIGYFISYIAVGSIENAQFNGIEFSCFIYLGITGSLGFNEDFKMAIQNGFTRKQIFLAAMGMFAFLTILMSLVDTVMAQVIQGFSPIYKSMFQQFYGLEHNILIQWFILMLVYFAIAISAYLFTLLCNKIGKKICLFVLITVGLIVIIILPLIINFYISDRVMEDFVIMLTRLLGYGADGGIQFMNPLLLLMAIGFLVSGFSYLTMKKTELK